jgi:hypothetical protein
MSIAGGNTTDDPINHREFVAANESGEGEYREKRRTEEHLGAGGKGPSSLRALYCNPWSSHLGQLTSLALSVCS